MVPFLCEDVTRLTFFQTIYYFLCGFDADASKFFTLFAIVLVSQFIAMAFAMLAASFSRNLANAALIGNLAYTMQSLASGFFLLTKSIPVYVRWTKWISYNYYAVAALNANEFTDSFYDCPLEAGINNPGCLEYKGNFVLESSGFSKGWILVPIIINIGFAIGFYVVAGLVLKYFTVDINVSSSKKNSDDNDRSAGKEKLSAPENSPAHKIDVFLEDYRLTVNKTGFFGKGKFELDILKGVSTRFESGKLNIIMGPSGSGKVGRPSGLVGYIKLTFSLVSLRCLISCLGDCTTRSRLAIPLPGKCCLMGQSHLTQWFNLCAHTLRRMTTHCFRP